jgi:hypothetical protein
VQATVDEDRGYGWLIFAGSMLMMLGILNVIEGIAAIDNSRFFVGNAHYVFGDLNTWGWVAVCLGVAQGLTGFGIFVQNQLARWVGVAVAGLNAIAQLLFIPAYPFWSLALFAVDILVVYGLIAYGGRPRAA